MFNFCHHLSFLFKFTMSTWIMDFAVIIMNLFNNFEYLLFLDMPLFPYLWWTLFSLPQFLSSRILLTNIDSCHWTCLGESLLFSSLLEATYLLPSGSVSNYFFLKSNIPKCVLIGSVLLQFTNLVVFSLRNFFLRLLNAFSFQFAHF